MPKHELTPERIRELFGKEVYVPKDPPPRRLDPDELEHFFGIRPVEPLTAEQAGRAKEIDLLFIDMYLFYGKSSLRVFAHAADDTDIESAALYAMHSHMLHHMSECPQFVVDYMRAELAPERLKRRSSHFTST